MARLALAAVLLMALAPTVSRVVAAGATQVLAGWTELCTAQGLKWVDTAAPSDPEKSPAPAPILLSSDCAYCPLAASLSLGLLFFFLVFPPLTGGRSALLYRTPPRTLVSLRGLGSQGPPVLL
jgi:hypothetical protein